MAGLNPAFPDYSNSLIMRRSLSVRLTVLSMAYDIDLNLV